MPKSIERRPGAATTRLLLLAVMSAAVSLNLLPGPSQSKTNDSELRLRIERIISKSIRAGESEVNGIRVWTPLPPDHDEAEAIFDEYGDRAAPILAEYLDSKDPRERHLAVRLLGVLGGESVLEPLTRAALRDPSPAIRESGLVWLAQVGAWEIVKPILQESAEEDPEELIRQAARELLDQGPSKP